MLLLLKKAYETFIQEIFIQQCLKYQLTNKKKLRKIF